MKLKEALKKFNFLKALDLSDDVKLGAANQLLRTIKGDSEIHVTPLAKSCDPIEFLVDWDIIYNKNKHKMNQTLLDLERGNRNKFGPRSIAAPWSARADGLRESYSNQDDNHVPKFNRPQGLGNLTPASLSDAADKMKSNTSAGFPFLKKKGKVKQQLLADFDKYLTREDPCALYTRTQEGGKTRNVWGYPFADTLYEMMFYIPILRLQKTKYYRAALVSPQLVSERITELILKARQSNRIIYSVDIERFDASVKFQYIQEAFLYFASCFMPMYRDLVSFVGTRLYSIAIVTPIAILRGKHGVPSGSTFTNEVDSIVQLGIALTNAFIRECECQIQGDDGVYIMLRSHISTFVESFKYAGFTLNQEKCHASSDYAMYCQNLYHIDYMKDGVIGGIYPTYRAINRLLFQERFVNFMKAGIKGKDYYGIRALTILENCKHHPLFEDLVRFVVAREQYSLDISDDGLLKYCNALNLDHVTISNMNHQYGSNVMGIRDFAAYKLVVKIVEDDEIAFCNSAI